jgi:hypothetical protein
MYLEEVSSWQVFYLPIDIRGKTVLDVGAGEGESSKFFLEHGAKKVICIEPGSEAFKKLAINAKHFKGIEPINDFFQLKHLQLEHDFLKMDIEGYEETLLDTIPPKPAVIEVHGLQLRDKFKARGYRIAANKEFGEIEFGCMTFAYWKC